MQFQNYKNDMIKVFLQAGENANAAAELYFNENLKQFCNICLLHNTFLIFTPILTGFNQIKQFLKEGRQPLKRIFLKTKT